MRRVASDGRLRSDRGGGAGPHAGTPLAALGGGRRIGVQDVSRAWWVTSGEEAIRRVYGSVRWVGLLDSPAWLRLPARRGHVLGTS